MSNQSQKEKPFFAQFLEDQEVAKAQGGAAETAKYPSDTDDMTMKYPSDTDEPRY